RKLGQPESLVVLAAITDQDGANWQIDQQFLEQEQNHILVRVSVKTNKDREVIFLPMLFLFPGVGTFVEKKTAAMFPGLEYLDEDEPSSSQKDIEGPGSQRQVPHTSKITIPVMGISNDLLYVGLMWNQTDAICEVVDSPDRLFASGVLVLE